MGIVAKFRCTDGSVTVLQDVDVANAHQGFAVIAFAKPALLPFALLMLCPLMHLFMHGGHGSHGTHNAKTEAVKITHRPNLDTGDK